MRGLTFDGVGIITYRTDLPEPKMEVPSDAIVTVRMAGLCGSDLHPYEGREGNRFGVVAGHEAMGEVAAVGEGVKTFEPGDRVLVPFTTSCGTCRPCRAGLSSRCKSGALFGYGDPDRPAAPALGGGQADRLRVPLADSTLVRVPGAVSNGEALLLCDNFPTGWYAAERAGIAHGQPAAVVGLGSVGLCAVVAAKSMGADPVVAIDPLPDRRDRATELGAEAALAEAVPLASFGSVIEAAGTAAAQQSAARLVEPGGSLSVISVPTVDRFEVTPIEAYNRNLTLRVGRAPVRSILDVLLSRVVSGALAVPADAILTHPRVPLDLGPETYRRFAAREPGMLKAAFAP